MATPPKGFQFENPQLFQDSSGFDFSVLSNLGQPDRAWSGLENVALEPIDTTGGGTGGGGGGGGGDGSGGGTFGNPPGLINGPPFTDGGGSGGTTDTGGGGFGGQPGGVGGTTITGTGGPGGSAFDVAGANAFMSQMGQSPLTQAELAILEGGGTGIGNQGQTTGLAGQTFVDPFPNETTPPGPPTAPPATPATTEGFQISQQQLQDQLAQLGIVLSEEEMASLDLSNQPQGFAPDPHGPNPMMGENPLSAEGKVSSAVQNITNEPQFTVTQEDLANNPVAQPPSMTAQAISAIAGLLGMNPQDPALAMAIANTLADLGLTPAQISGLVGIDVAQGVTSIGGQGVTPSGANVADPTTETEGAVSTTDPTGAAQSAAAAQAVAEANAIADAAIGDSSVGEGQGGSDSAAD